jgi:hypothetical protein
VLLPVLFPDAELIAVTYLKSALAPVPVHVRVPTTRPPKFVTVRRAGGISTGLVDLPRLDIFCWAKTDEEAKDLAQLAKARLGAIRGMRSGFLVTRVTDFAGLAPAPDQSEQPRWLFSIEMTVKGDPL